MAQDLEDLNDILNISLYSPSPSPPPQPSTTTSRTNPPTQPPQQPQQPRNAQSESSFQAIKTSYKPKLENGEIWQIKLPQLLQPISSSSTQTPPSQLSKPHLQTLLHAVEELYFFRRYQEGARVARHILTVTNTTNTTTTTAAAAAVTANLQSRDESGECDSESTEGGRAKGEVIGWYYPLLDVETRELLETYEEMCLRKLKGSG